MIELDNLLRATMKHGGETVGPVFAREFVAFSHDSRTVSPGELFVALRTEKADGHEFIDDAVARGASGILCERAPARLTGSSAAGVTVIRVNDTRAALLDWAAFVLDAVRPYRMAVTGAVGKSSARAALLRVLGFGDAGVFTNGNRNDELGLPLALGELRAGHGLAVLEVAADSAAELRRLGELLRPDTIVVTGAAAPSADDPASASIRDGIAAFVATLAPGGTLVLNGDDDNLAELLGAAGALRTGESPLPPRVLRYGLGAAVDVAGTATEQTAGGTTLAVGYRGETAQARLLSPGRGAIYAALAAVTAALGAGRGLHESVALLEGLPSEPGRLAPLQGCDGRTVLDDTFSANASSLALALETLALFPRPHAAVLGEISGVRHSGALAPGTVRRLLDLDRLVLQGREMAPLGRELRDRSPEPRRIILTYSARDSVDALRPVFERPSSRPASTASTTSATLNDGDGHEAAASPVRDIAELAAALLDPADRTPEAATVLVKGSVEARMERVVELLLPEPERAGAVLVRQDEGWRRRTYVPNERPTWVEVDLEAIRENLKALQAAAAPAEVMAVLKADAYGHGARWVARTAALNGAAMLGVASLNEALDLRADGILAPILILGYSPPWQARDLALSGIRATVYSLPVVEHFSRVAQDLGHPISVHIKVDTGMTRLGVLPDDVSAFVAAVTRLPGVHVEGIFSHMATSDTDVGFALEQGECFTRVVAELEAQGHRFRYVHMENSAAVMRRLPFAGNLVRTGLALYGLYPLPREQTDVLLRPALSFKTRVAQVKSVPPGTSVSYGRRFVTARESRIAVLPVGYGDGFRRSPADWGAVLVRGRRAPIAGVVAMDMTMIDVTNIPGVQEGDEAVLIGRQGNEAISVEDVAAALGTLSYEVVTQILPRVPRQTR